MEVRHPAETREGPGGAGLPGRKPYRSLKACLLPAPRFARLRVLSLPSPGSPFHLPPPLLSTRDVIKLKLQLRGK